MYTTVLILHSLVRWLVLFFGIMSALMGLQGWASGRGWTALDGQFSLWCTIVFDVQFLLGILLYAVLSPFTSAAFADFGAAMQNPGLRYWAVEHETLMVIALVLVHIGRVRIRKAAAPASKHRAAAIFVGIAMVLVLLGIPWPWFANGRPLIRF